MGPPPHYQPPGAAPASAAPAARFQQVREREARTDPQAVEHCQPFGVAPIGAVSAGEGDGSKNRLTGRDIASPLVQTLQKGFGKGIRRRNGKECADWKSGHFESVEPFWLAS
eukprot:1070800-Pelagomonas_calceolata.AAC.1